MTEGNMTLQQGFNTNLTKQLEKHLKKTREENRQLQKRLLELQAEVLRGQITCESLKTENENLRTHENTMRKA